MSTGDVQQLTGSVLHELQGAVRGTVHGPGDVDWDGVRMAWNLSVPQQPCAVVVAEDVDDVMATIKHAKQHGLTVATQPQGHGGTPAVDGCVLLRTGKLDGLTVDQARRTARVGAGTTWAQLHAATEPYGLAGLCGSSEGPSVVGYTLGGGLPWFGRRYGFAANSVLAFDVVDADGEQHHVTAGTDPELFWALRGGGGDFVVVTAMELMLYPVPHVYGGRRLWPVERSGEVMDAFRSACASAPDELSLWFHVFAPPPLDVVPEPLRGKQFVGIDATFLGSAQDGAELLRPVFAIDGQVMDNFGSVLPTGLSGIADEPLDPLPALDWAMPLRELSDGAAAAFLDTLGPGSGSPLLLGQIRQLGGALARDATTHGAIGCMRDPFMVLGVGVPMTPEIGAASMQRLGMLGSAMAPYEGSRRPYNFLTPRDSIDAAFSPEALERLRANKRRYDPDGVFRSNRPVLASGPPAAAEVPTQR